MNRRILERHLMALSHAYTIDVDSAWRRLIVRGFCLPPGYNRSAADLIL